MIQCVVLKVVHYTRVFMLVAKLGNCQSDITAIYVTPDIGVFIASLHISDHLGHFYKNKIHYETPVDIYDVCGNIYWLYMALTFDLYVCVCVCAGRSEVK